MKLCASRAFWLVAYPSKGHEMLFDAHTYRDRQPPTLPAFVSMKLESRTPSKPERCSRSSLPTWKDDPTPRHLRHRLAVRKRIAIACDSQTVDSR